MHQIPVFAFLVPIMGIVGTFTFVSIAVWAGARREERVAYYRSETIKKIAESQGGGPAALEYLREEDRIARRRARESQKLGGLVTAAVGVGLMVFLGAILDKDDRGVLLVGAIPFLIGVALLAYAYLLAPKNDV